MALVLINAAGSCGWLIIVVTLAPILSHTRQRLDHFGTGDCQFAQVWRASRAGDALRF